MAGTSIQMAGTSVDPSGSIQCATPSNIRVVFRRNNSRRSSSHFIPLDLTHLQVGLLDLINLMGFSAQLQHGAPIATQINMDNNNVLTGSQAQILLHPLLEPISLLIQIGTQIPAQLII
jgi:hypothetical protein